MGTVILVFMGMGWCSNTIIQLIKKVNFYDTPNLCLNFGADLMVRSSVIRLNSKLRDLKTFCIKEYLYLFTWNFWNCNF